MTNITRIGHITVRGYKKRNSGSTDTRKDRCWPVWAEGGGGEGG